MASISRVATLEIDVETKRIDAATTQLHRLGDEGESAGRRAKSGIEVMSPALERMARLAAEAFAVKRVLDYADAMTRLRGQLSIIVQGTEQLARVQAQLFDVAQRTRQEYEAVGELYARIVRSTRDLGLSQKQLIDTTEAVSRAVLISNVSTQTAQAGMYQLSQAFAAGRLQGQDFKAVIEDIPRLGQAIADGLGVSIGQLRAMSQAGEITSAKIVQALANSRATLEAESAKMPATVGQSFVVLENALKRWIDQQNQAFGVTSTLAAGLQSLARNLDTLAKGAEVVAAVFAARWLQSFAAANATTVEMYAQVARGNAVLLNGVTATRARAAAQVEETQATVADIQAKRAQLVAIQAQIAAQREAAAASVAAAQGRLVGAVNPASLAPLGGAVVARETAAQAAAQRQLNLALIAGNDAAARAVVVNGQLAAVDAELAVAEEAAAVAGRGLSAANAATAVTARLAAASMSVLNGALALVGGPLGAIVLAITAAVYAWNKYVDAATKSAELTDEQQAAYERALATERARNAAIKAATEEETRRQQVYAATIAQRQEEANKLRVLNDHFGEADAALKILEIQYDKNIEKAKNAVGHTVEQTAALNALTEAIAAQKIRAVELADAQEKLLAFQERMSTALERTLPQYTLVNKAYERTIASLKLLNEVAPQVGQIGARNKQTTDREDAERRRATEAAQKYSDDLERIWRDGIAKITTDGFKSFLDFAEDLNRLFTRIMDRMAERAKELGKEAGGAGFKALGYGVAALSGFSSGYASGSAGTGFIGGALAGSAFGPAGTFIGAVAGLTGGLLGGAKAARERQQAEEALKRSIEQTTLSVQHQIGAVSDADYQRAQIDEQQRQQDLAIEQSIRNDFRNKYGAFLGSHLDEMNAAIAAALAKNKDLFDQLRRSAEDSSSAAIVATRNEYLLRSLNATGRTDEAFALQQQMELAQAAAKGLDDVTIAMLKQAQADEKAQREREKQTQTLQDQLSTAQEQLSALKQVYDSLDAFGQSLQVGQYSPLSPRQQLDAARGQLNALYQSALGGDINAAGQFSGVAQQFLDASRRYNASGAGYVLDFNSVTVMTDALKQAFGGRIAETQQQIDLAQQQLTTLQQIALGIDTIVAEGFGVTPSGQLGTGRVSRPAQSGPIGTRIDADLVAVTQAAANENRAALAAIKAAIEESGRATSRSVDELAQRIA